MAELSPSRFDLMMHAVRRLTIVRAPFDACGWENALLNAVLWLVLINKSRVVDCWTGRDSDDHR